MVEQEADFAVLSVIVPRFTKEVTEEFVHFVGSVLWRTIFCLDSPTLAGHRSKLDIRKCSGLATLVVDGPERLEAFRLDADERRRRLHEAIENGMAPASLGEPKPGLDIQRARRPDFPLASGQRREVGRPAKKETERIDGQRRRGFRAVELAGRDLVAGGRRAPCC